MRFERGGTGDGLPKKVDITDWTAVLKQDESGSYQILKKNPAAPKYGERAMNQPAPDWTKKSPLVPSLPEPHGKGKKIQRRTVAEFRADGGINIHHVDIYPTGIQGTKKELTKKKSRQRNRVPKHTGAALLIGVDVIRNTYELMESQKSNWPKLGLVVDSLALAYAAHAARNAMKRAEGTAEDKKAVTHALLRKRREMEEQPRRGHKAEPPPRQRSDFPKHGREHGGTHGKHPGKH